MLIQLSANAIEHFFKVIATEEYPRKKKIESKNILRVFMVEYDINCFLFHMQYSFN